MVHRESATPLVVTTEFGALVVTAHDGEQRAALDPRGGQDRCWRCDTPPSGPVDDVGLCRPCGADLRRPPPA